LLNIVDENDFFNFKKFFFKTNIKKIKKISPPPPPIVVNNIIYVLCEILGRFKNK